MAEFDPYHKWLGIRTPERPPNHYRLLGIELFESDPEIIRLAADRQMAYVQKCANGPYQNLSQQILNELSAARVCLLAQAKRQAYDRKLKARQAAETSETAAEKYRPLQVAIDTFQAGPSASSRLKNGKKNQFSIPLISAAVAVIIGFVVYQTMGKPVDKPTSATATNQSDPRPKPSDIKAFPTEQAQDPAEVKATAAVPNENKAVAASTVASADESQPEKSVAADAAPEMVSEEPSPPEVAVAAISKSENLPDAASATGVAAETLIGKGEKNNEPSTKKSKAAVKKSKSKVKGVDTLDLPGAAFEVANSIRAGTSAASVESPAGQNRLAELTRQVRDANKQCGEIAKKWSVEMVERNSIASSLPEKQEQMVQSGSAVKRLDDLLLPMKDRPRFSNDPVSIQQGKLEEERNKANGIFEQRTNEITNGVARINELSTSLQSEQEQWKQTWDQLNATRKQWLEIAQPLEKYGRADFEGARGLIERWLGNDELWLDAHCWAAICAFELGDYSSALEHIELAEKFCTAPYRTKRAVSLIHATHALVVLGIPQQRSKSDGFVTKAMTDVDKQNDWQTYFIAGRAAMELGRQDSKAKAYLGRALSINSTCECANYSLGRLQSTSSDASVRDLSSGIKLLESVWTNSNKQSWRISFALVRAYDAEKQSDQAERQWQTTLTLAPTVQHEGLKKQRSQ